MESKRDAEYHAAIIRKFEKTGLVYYQEVFGHVLLFDRAHSFDCSGV